jgi:UDP-2-acetamido-2-deoxy-ribo-hexuluronate aminotransferase
MLQFIDLQAQYSRLQEEMEQAVLGVLRSGKYIMGPEVAELEAELSRFVVMEYCVSCASGTDALVMALMAKSIGPGDAVFTTPFTFVASAEAIATVGATPIFVDIDPASFNIDASKLSAAIERIRRDGTLAAKAIIAVDLFGLPADYQAINDIAAREGLLVIEDAAQSFGASAGNRRAGSLAEIGCTSFFPAKPLGCYGDGGAIFTDDPEVANVLRSIRVHGQGSDKYENVRLGITGRLDTVQAAVLLVKLKVFEREIEDRQRVAAAYSAAIHDAGLQLQTPHVPDGYLSAWAQYSVLAESASERERLIQRLAAAGIPTAIYYPKPLHLQQAFAYLGHHPGDFPASEDAASRIFSLPMHPYLDEVTIGQIVSALAGKSQ